MKNNIFTQVQMSKPPVSRFDLSHDVKLSFSMGELIPTCVMEALPGDKFDISVENFLRFAPLISPVMHKVNVTTHYFFVPSRILWPEWEKWITGDSDVQAPFFQVGAAPAIVDVGSIGDYLGLPTGNSGSGPVNINALPAAAYAKIYDDFYRDQNLETEIFVPVVAGNNSAYADFVQEAPLRRAWQHDYFTSALPFPQKGPDVQIPLTVQNDIPVDYNNPDQLPGTFRRADGDIPSLNSAVVQDTGPVPFSQSAHIDGDPVAYDPRGTLTVDVQADATDINTLRRAFRLQEWLERNARGGTRYIESIFAHWGVKSSDSRLQRPEYLGGSRQNMVISEVLATAQNTTDGVAVGTMAGHGISVGGGNRFRYRAEEHGYVIGIINVQPVTAYQQGLHRMFSRLDRLDYAWPTFANIGEQEILQKELYFASTTPDAVFGYIPRYSEYKFMNSRVAGEMRTSLNFWHMGRIFDSDPALNEDFIKAYPTTRIFAVTSEAEDHIFAHVFNNIKAVRKLPRFGVPTI